MSEATLSAITRTETLATFRELAKVIDTARTYSRATSLPDIVESRYLSSASWEETARLLRYVARRSRHTTFLTATIDGRVVAVLDAGNKGYGVQVWTHPNYRRQGLASMLLRQCFDQFGRVAINPAILHERDVSPWFYAWIKRNGFRLRVNRKTGAVVYRVR